MTATIRKIQDARPPDPDVVDFLEGMLLLAKAGELVGFAGVKLMDHGALQYTTVGISDRFKAIGCLAHAMHRLNYDE